MEWKTRIFFQLGVSKIFNRKETVAELDLGEAFICCDWLGWKDTEQSEDDWWK